MLSHIGIQSRISKMPHGQAALLAILIVAVVGSFTAAAVSTVTLNRLRLGREVVTSLQSYQVGEAGIEDGILGLVDASLAHNASDYNLTLNGVSTVVSTTQTGSTATISSVATGSNITRALSSTLTTSTQGVSFHYGVQVGQGGLSMSNGSRINGSVYSGGDITGGNNSVITGDAIVAGGVGSIPSFEWLTQNADYFFATASSNRDVAQSFNVPVSDTLNRVSVYLGKVGSPGSNLTLRVTSDNGSKPANASLATAVIAPSRVGLTPSWIDVSLSNPPTLTSGTKYWIVLDYGSSSATNYWNWRLDTTDGYANNTGKYTSSCCSGSPTWSNAGGDFAFQVWQGGTNTKIQGLTIGDAASGTAQANLFVSTTVRGSACPNAYCVISNPPAIDLPISEGLIQDWRNAAAAGGTCTTPTCDSVGDLRLANSVSATIGPTKITGDIIAGNGVTLTVTGTIWVQGDLSFGNTCVIQLDPAYGTNSGVIVVDGEISLANGCSIVGSGNSASHLMLLSDKNDPTENVIRVGNTGAGNVIYYARQGQIGLANGVHLKEVVGYGLNLGNSVVIDYDSGLANTNFSSGPGGGWTITTWQEVE